MNCQKCQSIDSNVYTLASGRRSLSLCVSCYNKLKDAILVKELGIEDWQLRARIYLSCLTGSGIADSQRAFGVLSTYKTNETNAQTELVADIDAFINESKS